MSKKAEKSDASRGGFLGSAGSILMGLAGIAFVAYVFNYAGLQTTLDSYFGGLNRSAHSHNDQVTSVFMVVFPVAATLLAAAILYILGSALVHAVMSPVKEAKKKKAKALLKAQKAAAQPPAHAAAKEAMVLIRPARINFQDHGVETIAAR